jgi:hypothetical protein
MKKSFKQLIASKKVKLLLTGAAVITMGVGTTYAWWTAESSDATQIVMGAMNVKTDFSGLKDQVGFEPGLTNEGNGSITNTGSIESLVKINSDSQIEYVLNSDGTAIEQANRKFQALDPNAIKVTFTPTIDESNVDGFWFTDSEGNAYALLEPGASLNVAVVEEFTGEGIGNQYMNAVVKTNVKANAAQALDSAAQASFGISMDDLTLCESAESSDGIQYKSVSDNYHNLGMKALQEAMKR